MSGIYIHIPFCKKKCNYCDFYSLSHNESLENKYVVSLINELKNKAKNIKDVFDTIYMGGGTPSLLSIDNIKNIADVIRENYNISDKLEFSIEGNPSDFIDLKKLESLNEIGINRVSIGIQSMNQALLDRIGRQQKAEDNLLAIQNVSKIFNNFSVDHIIGLPGQNLDAIKEDIECIIEHKIPHVSAYALKIEPNTPLFEEIEKTDIMQDDDVVSMYDYIYKVLSEYKYNRYEISNFAQKKYECKHNLNYWRCGSYLGFGPGAHSYFNGVRFENPRSINAYINSIEKGLDPSENHIEIDPRNKLFEKIMLGLRLKEGLNIEDINKNFNIDFLKKYEKILNKYRECFLIDQGLLKVKDEYLYVINSILVLFLED